MATIHGNAIGIYVGANAGDTTAPLDPDNAELVACSTNATLSLSNATIETACKKDTTGVLDDASVRHTIPGQQTWSMQVEGLVELVAPAATANNFQSLFELTKDRTDVLVVFSDRVASNYEYYGLGFISSIEISASVDDFATYSCTIEGNGDISSAAHT
jgi:TP901-1 family phage major tail protein